MNAGQLISDVVLRQHDLPDLCEILRLFILHPEYLRRGKAGEGNVRRVSRQLLLTDHVIQIIAFLRSPAVIPQNSRSDHLIILV